MNRFFLALLSLALPAFTQPLKDALEANRFDLAKTLLQKGTYVDQPNRKGATALHWAAGTDQVPAIKFLLEHGADLEGRDENGTTPLMAACEKGNLKAVQALVSSGARVNQSPEPNYTPLTLAVWGWHKPVIEYLLQKGADPQLESQVKFGPSDGPRNALFLALRVPDTNAFEMVYNAKPNPNLTLHDGQTLLMAAAAANRLDIVKRLILAKVDVRPTDEHGNSALMHACESNVDSTILEVLLQNGADANQANQFDQTPLRTASAGQSLANVRVLLRHRADLNATTRQLQMALLEALKSNKFEIAKLLLEQGATPIDASTNGNNYVYLAMNGNAELTKMVLAAGPDMNQKYAPTIYSPSNPFFHILPAAAARGWGDVIDLAMAKGADPLLPDNQNTLPLDVAFQHNQFRAFQVLVAKGAPLDSQKLDTYLRWIVQSDDSLSTISHLIKRGANVNGRNTSGETPLMIAAGAKQISNVILLLKAKSDLSLRSSEGNAALHYAIDSGCMDCAKILADKGASVNAVNRAKIPLLVTAVGRQDTVMAKWLLSKGAQATTSEELYPLVFGKDGSLGVARFVVQHFPKLKLGKALLAAAEFGKTDIAKLLLDQGADINARDALGRTPLMKASLYLGNDEVRNLLLANGADPDAKDHQGHTADWLRGETEGD